MKITIVAGSTRAGAQSLRVAQYIKKELTSLGAVTLDVVDLHQAKLPVFDDTEHEEWVAVAKQLEGSDGFVFVVPEWHGMACPGMANFLTYAANTKLFAHRPAVLVGVSNARGGRYPLTQLRLSSFKNSHVVYLPENMVVGFVNEMLHGDEPASKDDEYIRGRIQYNLKLLLEYIPALQLVRDSGVIDDKKYANGM